MFINELDKQLTDNLITTIKTDNENWIKYFNDTGYKLNAKTGREYLSMLSTMSLALAKHLNADVLKNEPGYEDLANLWVPITVVKSHNLWKEAFNGKNKIEHFANAESPVFVVHFQTTDGKINTYSVMTKKGNERNIFFTSELDKIKKELEKRPDVVRDSIHNDIAFYKSIPLYHSSQLNQKKLKELILSGKFKGENKEMLKLNEGNKHLPDISKIKLTYEDTMEIGKVYLIKELGRTMYANIKKIEVNTNPHYSQAIKSYLEKLTDENKYIEVKSVFNKAKGLCKSLIQKDKEKQIRKNEEYVLNRYPR